jgi:hypothetical protein
MCGQRILELFLTIAVVSGYCGCRRVDDPPLTPDFPSVLRLAPTEIGRDVIAKAIEQTNSLLENQVKIRLRPGWIVSAQAGPYVDVPIFLVNGNRFPQSLAFVPERYRCVIINGENVLRPADVARVKFDTLDLADTADRAGTRGDAGTPDDALTTDSVRRFGENENLVDFWTMILLHETGHVFFSDYLLNQQAVIEDGGELNLVREVSKIVELRSDHFGAMQVRITLNPASRGDWMIGLAPKTESQAAARYLSNPLPGGASLEARIIASRLQTLVLTVGFNAYKLVANPQNFGAETKKAFAWDRGYSHPNLGLRFLYMACLIDPSARSSREELLQFLEARDQKAFDALYRAEYTGLRREP